MPLAWSFNGVAVDRPDASLPIQIQSIFEGYLRGIKNE
jgi:hypothetical protein